MKSSPGHGTNSAVAYDARQTQLDEFSPVLGQAATASAVLRPAYYPALDGLRAIAAILVFLHHYASLPLGWVGVDVFFVLSGFLITGILYESRYSVRRYRDFYIRRSLRIFPLYYALLGLVLLASAGAGIPLLWPVALWPLYLGNYLRSILSTSLYDGIGLVVLGHLWSLCVEEQFYLIWPTVVFSAFSRKRIERLCVAVITIVPLVRAVLCWLLPSRLIELESLYRAMPTRLDALVIGALVAMLLRAPGGTRTLALGKPLLWGSSGAFVIAALIAFFCGADPFKTATSWMTVFGYTLLDFAAAGLLLLALEPRSIISRCLRVSPLRQFGQVTYGFYVLHLLPVRVFERVSAGMTPWSRVLLVMAMFLLAWGGARLSYDYFEKPFLKLKDRLAPLGELKR